jgi:ABC-type bacteriocin/lantibiotic exporter with double-glycine peptidase domain
MEFLTKVIGFLKPCEKRRAMIILLLILGLAILETFAIASVMPFLMLLSNPKIIYSNIIFQNLFQLTSKFGINTTEEFLITLGCISFLIILFSSIYRAFINYIISQFIEMTRHSISTRLLEKYLKQPYVFNLTRHSGDLSKMIISEVDEMVRNVYLPVFNIFLHTMVIMAIFFLIISINTFVAFFVVIFLGTIFYLIHYLASNKLKKIGEILVRVNKDRFITISEVFKGIKPIKLLGVEFEYQSRYSDISLSQAITLTKLQTIKQTPNYLIEVLILGTVFLITLILLFSSGGLSNSSLEQIFPIVGLNAFSAYRLKPSFNQIYSSFVSLRIGKALIDSINKDWISLKFPLKIVEQPTKLLHVKKHMSFENVSYTYLNSRNPAITMINLSIPLGSSIGIVGTTGAGKTTLVDVFLGLLRPTSGAICVDGKPIGDDEIPAWQRNLGYVPQDIFLMDATIAENIALGLPKNSVNYEQIRRCAKISQISQFIENELPNQYDTIVGEQGVGLSGGQRQRIGIARALYHNPDILVLDEATSSLDVITEQEVIEAIRQNKGVKTLIIITHRLSTIKNCNQILHLERGQIIDISNSPYYS